MVSFQEFSNIQLRVARVLDCQPVEGSAKLFKLSLSLGPQDTRTVASGIAGSYSPADLVGKKVILVANLDPRIIRGVQSQGMLLASEDAMGAVRVVFVDDSVPEGALVH